MLFEIVSAVPLQIATEENLTRSRPMLNLMSQNAQVLNFPEFSRKRRVSKVQSNDLAKFVTKKLFLKRLCLEKRQPSAPQNRVLSLGGYRRHNDLQNLQHHHPRATAQEEPRAPTLAQRNPTITALLTAPSRPTASTSRDCDKMTSTEMPEELVDFIVENDAPR